MGFQLTQKEQLLLKDQLSHEKVCIEKYSNYVEQARDPQLKQLFNQYGSQEQQHYDTINQLLQGQQVSTQGGQGQQQGLQAGQFMEWKGQQLVGQQVSAGMTMQDDAMLCSDILMTEKYISGTYDTAIFESVNPNIRQALQHIQKEEQQHGEGIFNYMQQHGMYNPK